MIRRTFIQRLKVWLARLMSPGYSDCLQCHMPWKYAEPHVTYLNRNHPGSEVCGVFPLCESCWKSMTPNERLKWYRLLWRMGTRSSSWDVIATAVRKGG